MSNYFIQPEIETWQSQLEPFVATIIAYDGNGNRIRNKQLYIVYNITYNNATPNLNYGTILYANQDGIIELHLDSKCKISIDLYMTSEYNETLGQDDIGNNYICEHICDNLLLPFQPYIVSFTAEYISEQKIACRDIIPRKYVKVKLVKSDDSTATFTLESEVYKDYHIVPDTVEHINENDISVTYYDSLLDKTWKYDIIVYGKDQEIELLTNYIGETKQLNNIVLKTEVLVTLVTWDGYHEHTRLLDNDEWEFTEFPQITNTNLGLLGVSHNELKSKVKIKFIWAPIKFRLDAWYEGDPVRVGEKFVPDDFIIYLYYENGTRTMMHFNQFLIEPDDYVIHKVGLNWYELILRIDSWTIREKVAIIGYEDSWYPEYDFTMWYLNPNTKSKEDVTAVFDDVTMIGDRRWFNWEKIQKRIIEYSLYGKFLLYAPVLTGLSTRCATKWKIYCEHRKVIRAELLKQFITKEDEEDG